MKSNKRQVLVVFDFDGTLINGDSFLKFAQHALSPLRLLKGVLKASPALVGWKLGITNASKAKEIFFSALYKGLAQSELQAKAESFADYLDGITNVDTMRILNRLKRDGAKITILSASPGLWIRPWASRHGIDSVISTEASFEDGKATGTFSTPNCKGEEKIRRLLEVYPDRKSYHLEAWGDSDDDIPLLRFADQGHRIGK